MKKKTFNDLFNEFIKNRKTNPSQDIFDILKNEAKSILEKLESGEELSNHEIDEETEKEFDMSLGEPDSIEYYDDGELYYERRTWHTKKGDLVKLIVSDVPLVKETPTPKKRKTSKEKIEDLERQLNEAVENEDFEKAAVLRDKINKNVK